jgi:hypothetical protein
LPAFLAGQLSKIAIPHSSSRHTTHIHPDTKPPLSNHVAVMPLYVDPALVKMRDAFQSGGLDALSKQILVQEREFAVNPGVSRILGQLDYHGNAEMLLAQIKPHVLESILSNSLPADAADPTKPGFLPPWNKISPHAQAPDKKDPGVYANFLAPRDGSALTLDEYQRFLEALEAALRGDQMTNGRDICQEVNTYYRINHRAGAFLEDAMRTAAFRLSYGTFLAENDARLQAARAQGATHITIPGECGWADNVHSRCKEHKTLQSSPDIFRVANCVLRVLFVSKDFQMHQFCLFKVCRAEQAGIGESIGHHLVLSYGKYGGFNFAQAGLSISSAASLTFTAWLIACDNQTGLLKYIRTRLDDEDATLEADIKRAKVRKIAITLFWFTR